MYNKKAIISVIIAFLMIFCVALSFSACKKENKNQDNTSTSKVLTPEEQSILESQLEKDDNVVEDPFADDDDDDVESANNSKSGSSGSSSSKSGSNSGSSGSNSGNGSSGSGSSESSEAEIPENTDEDGNRWTGWY